MAKLTWRELEEYLKDSVPPKLLQDFKKRWDDGQAKYGELDLDTDPRDWIEEARQEMIDCNIYLAFEAIKRSRK